MLEKREFMVAHWVEWVPSVQKLKLLVAATLGLSPSVAYHAHLFFCPL